MYRVTKKVPPVDGMRETAEMRNEGRVVGVGVEEAEACGET